MYENLFRNVALTAYVVLVLAGMAVTQTSGLGLPTVPWLAVLAMVLCAVAGGGAVYFAAGVCGCNVDDFNVKQIEAFAAAYAEFKAKQEAAKEA